MKKILSALLSSLLLLSFASCSSDNNSNNKAKSNAQSEADLKEDAELKEKLKASNEAFNNGQASEEALDYKKAIEYYSEVIEEDENYSEAATKIERLQNLIDSGNMYAEGVQYFYEGNYTEALNKLCNVISEDVNYQDAVLKIEECKSVLKTNLITLLEQCKAVNDYTQALSAISSAPTQLSGDETILEYKSHFETAKAEHEAALALESEKSSYDLSSESGLESYLSKYYPQTETSVGTYSFNFECWENDFSFYGYDYQIKVTAENDYLFANLASYSNDYTSAQKAQVKKELKNFMYQMANDVMTRSPVRIKMFYDASYDIYEYVSGGYRYNAYCTCANYDYSYESALISSDDTYEKTPRTGFRWYPKNDAEQW